MLSNQRRVKVVTAKDQYEFELKINEAIEDIEDDFFTPVQDIKFATDAEGYYAILIYRLRDDDTDFDDDDTDETK